jgi:cyclohexadienyl dehydratase
VLVALGLAACARGVPDVSPQPLVIGTSGDYPPFSREVGGAYDGLDLAVARRFARDTSRRLVVVRFRWPELTADLTAGRFEVAMSGVTVRPERALAGTFTRPVVETGAVVLTRRGLAATPAHVDRIGTRLGVNRGGYLERVARRRFPHAEVTPVDDNRALLRLLATGAVEAILMDALEADAVPGAVRLGPITRDRKAYLGRDPALVAELDAWLRAQEADGVLAKLRGKWLGPAHAGPRSGFDSDLDALLALVDLRVAFMPAVAAAKERARVPVDDEAQEERVVVTARKRAADLGVDPDGVERLFRAQIAAARQVQREFLAAPAPRRPPVETLDLARDARPALARISDAIVDRAADLAREPATLARLDPGRLAEALDTGLVTAPARREIAGALIALRPLATPGGRPAPSLAPPLLRTAAP